MKHLKKIIAVVSILVVHFSSSYAQYSITGANCVLPGLYTSEPHRINGNIGSNSGAGDKWCITGGKINGSSCYTNPGNPYCANIAWDYGVTTGTVSYYRPASASTPVVTYTVNIINPGTISPSPIVVPLGVPTNINITGSAVTGCGTVSYKWQKQVNGVYTDIPGATGKDYNNIETISVLTNFWRVTIYNGMTARTSAPCYVSPQVPHVPGVIGPATQTITSGMTPGLLSLSSPSSGGNCGGNYNNYWQISTDNNVFTDISPIQTGSSYQPLQLNQTRYYRLRVGCGSLQNGVFSNSVAVHVTVPQEPLSPGTLSVTNSPVAVGSTVTVGGSPATGGLCTGNYIYQWERSYKEGGEFEVIPGATSSYYMAGGLNETSFFRRKVSLSCNSEVRYSNTVKIRVLLPVYNENFVRERTFMDGGGLDEAETNYAYRQSDVIESIQYFDGLGRPMQTVHVKGSPEMQDIVQPYLYDSKGREAIRYLPYEDPGPANGSYKANALAPGQGVTAFYNPSGSIGDQQANGMVRTTAPCGVNVYEASPLNRLQEQGAPGEVWQPAGNRTSTAGRTVVSTYGTNNSLTTYTTTGFAARLWTAVPVTTSGQAHKRNLSSEGFYLTNSLFLTVTKDENWVSSDGKVGTVEEYRDKDNRVVLKRSFNKAGTVIETLSTYYVYDDLGNLSFVLPPGAEPDGSASGSASINTTTLENICYQYFYDGRNRLVEKKLPGKGWEFLVYNDLDQVVMSQDAIQRGKPTQEWLVTKYDALGRVAVTAIFAHPGSVANADYRSVIQSEVDTQTNQWETRDAGAEYTTNRTYPTSGLTTILSVNYYDNYSVPGLPAIAPYNQAGSYSNMTKGLATVRKTNVLGTSAMLWGVTYYDNKGRAVKNVNQHYKGGFLASSNYDEIVNVYRFSGEVTASTRRHYVEGVENLYIRNDYTYDHQGRKRNTTQVTGDNASTSNPKVILSRNNYNPVGQLKGMDLHSTNSGSNFAQTVSYKYNPRGWMEGQTSPLFTQSLTYESPVTGAVPQYNGNISRQEWGTGKYYNYTYDRLNRLLTAISGDGNNESVSYDKMGNIQTMQRQKLNVLEDQLSYSYSGNRLTSVSDASTGNSSLEYQLPGLTSYVYDVNGSLTSRSNTINTGNNITSIAYNYLNLPQSLTTSGTAITYTYDAAGNKMRKKVASVNVDNDYISGIHYEGGELKFVNTEVGRVVRVGANNYHYEYTLADHLGNGRVYFDINSSGVARTVQEMDYYAFGLGIMRSLTGSENKYEYNGKEKQDQEKMYDYGARFYDPVIARWLTVDPLADSFPWQSGYASFDNNPINKIDPDGRAAYSPIYGTDGTLLGTDDEGLKGKAIVMEKDKFEQGMKHEDALKENLGWQGLEGDKAKSDLLSSYNGLKDRPDYDGHVTLDEANKWFREGNGQPLYVDLAKIDLSAIKQGDFKTDRKVTYFQTLFNSKDGRVYGNIGLSLENGRAKGTYDKYDFDIKRYTNKTTITPAELIIRNAATQIGNAVAGSGTGYRIYFNGTAPIKR